MADIATHSINHPALGDITGRLVNDRENAEAQVVHFRSIPYATIPARFKPSVLLDSLPEKFDDRPRADFTKYGYACPAEPQGRDLYGGRLDGEEDRKFDEFACLNLTISAPKKYLDAKSEGEDVKLPVMVYVHGGGFAMGAGHTSALHETTRLVALSVKDDMPVVIVSIGYRLNWFGFLACHDLLEEAAASSPSFSPFNLGLHDQRNAFFWIHKHISGFGGDATNITAFGESAGSASLAFHLCCEVPLFKRVILESGQVGTIPTPPLELRDQVYQRLLTSLNITGASASDRLSALRQAPATKLVEACHLNGNIFVPHTSDLDPHGFFAAGNPSYWNYPSLIEKCDWIEDLILGDTHFEGEVLARLLRMVDQSLFISNMTAVLGTSLAQRLLDAYDIPLEGNIPANLFWRKLMELVGDMMFSDPTERLADALAGNSSSEKLSGAKTKKVYRYAMCLSNPFIGTGLVWHTGQHCIEMCYVFLTLTERYPTWRDKFLERQAFSTARRWLSFANGIPPWDEYLAKKDGSGKIAVCDDLTGWTVRSVKEDEEMSKNDPWGPRRYEARRIWKTVWEEVAGADGMEGTGGLGEQAMRTEMARLRIMNFPALVKPVPDVTG